MEKPPIPADETLRLRALQTLKILDTQPEERFERITRLARRLFGTEIALLSLVDESRQWFKSAQGLAATETPREISFCGHAINSHDLLVVNDARADSRFHDNPLVAGDPNIRFYAGCPVADPSGHNMGTLCVIDSQPRQMSADDEQSLVELGQMIEDELASLAMATTDELTGLANRRGFQQIAAHVLPLTERLGTPLSLLHFDLDNLKTVNDTEGHDAGDRLIIEFGKLLMKKFRESDIVARLGGDEFCVLASGAVADDAKALLQRLQQACQDEADVPMEFSAGIAIRDVARHPGIDELLKEADCRMYENKRAKRAVADAAAIA